MREEGRATDRTILHVDMDMFFAAVEIRDDPSLAGKPLIIGAKPGERGVVSTCSYEARKYGVRSAMSVAEAYRRCPHGIYMHPSGEKYVAASRQVHAIWGDYTDLVEHISLDEGFLDLTGSAHLFGGAREIGWEIKRRTKEEVGLTCSVGIAYCMTAAKLASEEKKPDGYFELMTPKAYRELVIDRNVRILLGVGVKTAQVLEGAGLRTVRDLLADPNGVIALLGNHGREILALAQGIDERVVTPYSEPKSIGKEHTFQKDTTDFDYLKDMLVLIARELSYDIREQGYYASTVTLKITYAGMQQITRSRTGPSTNRADEICKVASSLLDGIERRPIRLIGISLGSLSRTRVQQISLMEAAAADDKRSKVDSVAFQLQRKFGKEAIKTGNELKAQRRMEEGED